MAGMDVGDILGARPSAERRITPRNSHKPPAVKKPDGVSREVFALTGAMPCVVPTAASSGAYKERRTAGNVVPWRWREFGNPGRKDTAKMHHWAKKHDTEEYYFSQYNKLMKIDKYTDAEYDEHMKDPDWTKQQTDELLELADRFDTRFIVMADRVESGKSCEEIKARYYGVQRKLLEIRAEHTDEELAKMPLARFQYDKEYDTRRKEQLHVILSRTVQEMAAEHRLIQELQAIDSTMKKDQKLRSRARKAAEQGGASPTLGGEGTGRSGTRSRQAQSKKMRIGAGGGSNKTLIVKVKGGGVPAAGERKSTQRRSMMASAPDASNEAKVLKRVQELGVQPWPLPMANVCAAHAELVKDVGLLMDLERKLAKRKK